MTITRNILFSKAYFPQDDIYDFALGPKTYSFVLNPLIPAVYSNHNSEDSDPGVNYNYQKWQIRQFNNNSSSVYVHSATESSKDFTRVKTQSNDNIWRGIFGDNYRYTMAVNAIGTQNVEFRLYHYPLVDDATTLGSYKHTWTVFQKAKATTRDNNGLLVPDGATWYNLKNDPTGTINITRNNVSLDTTDTWTILYYSLNSGEWITCPTSYYTITSGSLSTDSIALYFTHVSNDIGSYRIVNTAVGDSNANTGGNIDTSYLSIELSKGVLNFQGETEKTLTVISNVSANTAAGNFVFTTNPYIVGLETLKVSVSPLFQSNSPGEGLLLKTYTNVTDSTTIELVPPAIISYGGQKESVQARAKITCVARLVGNNFSVIKYGWGPHSFTLPAGTFSIGYEFLNREGNGILVDRS
jgi:hypothetical protein